MRTSKGVKVAYLSSEVSNTHAYGVRWLSGWPLHLAIGGVGNDQLESAGIMLEKGVLQKGGNQKCNADRQQPRRRGNP
jgi:hypothetical protein